MFLDIGFQIRFLDIGFYIRFYARFLNMGFNMFLSIGLLLLWKIIVLLRERDTNV